MQFGGDGSPVYLCHYGAGSHVEVYHCGAGPPWPPLLVFGPEEVCYCGAESPMELCNYGAGPQWSNGDTQLTDQRIYCRYLAPRYPHLSKS